MLKPDWPTQSPGDPDAPFGPNKAAIEACLERARSLSRSDMVRLDIAERRDPDLLLAAWDHIRDRLSQEPLRSRRFAAREAAWLAVEAAAVRLGIDPPVDDGYWRASMAVGAGAARVTRYTACALVAPDALEPDLFHLVLDVWSSVLGDLEVPNP